MRAASSEGAAGEFDLTNIVPFRGRRRDGATDAAPAIVTGEAERPTVRLPERGHSWRWTALLLLSAAAHAALYLPFGREPPPMASIGEVSMSVEIVLGSQRPAGLTAENATSDTASPTPAQSAEAAEEPQPEPEPGKTETAAVELPQQTETAEPVQQVIPEAEQRLVESPPAAEPEQNPLETALASEAPPGPPHAPQEQFAVAAGINTPAAVEPRPLETAVALPTPPAAAPMITPEAATIVREPLRQRTEPPKSQAKLAKPEPQRPAARAERKPERRQAALRGEPNHSRTTAPASAAANGVGVGRSDASTNYRGIVAAHLARHKQFPPEARSRGDQGSAVVTFALDGRGRVTSVSLSRGTGIGALDGEAVAMVRRASPFPPPPSGRGMSFTVPVSFRIF